MSNSENIELDPIWQKARITSVLIASVLIPIIVAFIGNSYTKAIKDNEIGVRYVELAIKILAEKPDSKPEGTKDSNRLENKAVRKWAVEVIDHYSDVKLPTDAMEQLEMQLLIRNVEEITDLIKDL
jgi:hypothetical protein